MISSRDIPSVWCVEECVQQPDDGEQGMREEASDKNCNQKKRGLEGGWTRAAQEELQDNKTRAGGGM
jgi:hypothetical protein